MNDFNKVQRDRLRRLNGDTDKLTVAAGVAVAVAWLLGIAITLAWWGWVAYLMYFWIAN